MKVMIAKLEAALEGSQEMDAETLLSYQPHNEQSEYLIGFGGWLIFKNTRSNALLAPPHTTSLDAKVPGENIVEMNGDEDEWNAWHEGKLGKLFMGAANTEILARRIAGLKGLEND